MEGRRHGLHREGGDGEQRGPRQCSGVMGMWWESRARRLAVYGRRVEKGRRWGGEMDDVKLTRTARPVKKQRRL
jgi:hypothetical protein